MSIWLKDSDLRQTQWTHDSSESPIPSRVLSNGEFMPPPQSRKQARVEQAIKELGDDFGRKQGMSRREFLRTNCGMAAAFLAMNMVYGPLFSVDPVEAADRDKTNERTKALSNQFIFDVQLHFVHDAYPSKNMLGLRELARRWNPELKGEKPTLERIKFENFVKEVYLDSQTTVGLLSSAPSDSPEGWFLTNDQTARARTIINGLAGSKRLLCHAVFTPGQPGWLDEVDRAIGELKPDSWKGYTLGTPGGDSKYPWRLDDEKLVYPAYEKMVKAGIKNVCIHKGLLPANYKKTHPNQWSYGAVDDLGKAARDWPQLNFVIYHSALESMSDDPERQFQAFEKTGRIPWVTDLAEIPQKHGVSNVYGEIGSSFAATCIAYPKLCAAMLGTLVKGLGADHVVWGTDSIWYGSPQWQIEAMRRIEIPEDLQKEYGFSALGPADGEVKQAIFGLNSAKLYGIGPVKEYTALRDHFAELKGEREPAERTNRFYGLIHRASV
jgi:predicted TIM-barrel fold metal-dependent hydrolase